MNKVLKRILIGIGVFFGVIIILAGAFTIWQWSNIKALYIGLTQDEQTILEEAKKEDEKLTEDIKNSLSLDIRDFTDAELAMIESGEKTRAEIIAQIIAESVETATENEEQTAAGPGSDGETPTEKAKPAETSDQIVARHVAKLYEYQGEFEGRVNALIGTVKAYGKSYLATHPGATKRDAGIAAVQQYMSSASSIESDCYAKVDAEIAALRAELKAIGADMSIADTVAASAEKQMEIKKAQFVSQYRSKLG